MHWAVTQHTAAEIIHSRVDSSKPYAGLTNFKSGQPTVAEARVAKNYLFEGEIAALNHITSLTLEFFESQAEQRKSTTLSQFISRMRSLILLDGRPLISEGGRGKVSMNEANNKATAEMYRYKMKLKQVREAQGEKELTKILSDVKRRPSTRK